MFFIFLIDMSNDHKQSGIKDASFKVVCIQGCISFNPQPIAHGTCRKVWLGWENPHLRQESLTGRAVKVTAQSVTSHTVPRNAQNWGNACDFFYFWKMQINLIIIKCKSTGVVYLPKQNKSTDGYSKLKSPETREVQETSLNTQCGTGQGVRRSKRPLLACRTRWKCSMETSHNKVKSQIR